MKLNMKSINRSKSLMVQTTMMLLFTLFSTNGAWAQDNYSGNCGKTGTDGSDVTWTYNPDSKTLTISGTGEMVDYANADSQPWKSYRNVIKSIVIGSGVTTIGKNAFNGCTGVTVTVNAECITVR